MWLSYSAWLPTMSWMCNRSEMRKTWHVTEPLFSPFSPQSAAPMTLGHQMQRLMTSAGKRKVCIFSLTLMQVTSSMKGQSVCCARLRKPVNAFQGNRLCRIAVFHTREVDPSAPKWHTLTQLSVSPLICSGMTDFSGLFDDGLGLVSCTIGTALHGQTAASCFTRKKQLLSKYFFHLELLTPLLYYRDLLKSLSQICFIYLFRINATQTLNEAQIFRCF